MSAPQATAVLTAALPHIHTWQHRPTAADLSCLPNRPAIYLLISAEGHAVQLATTQALRRLLTARLALPIGTPKRGPDLAEVARAVRWRELATAFEGRWWYYNLARLLYPDRYRGMIAFGPAYFLHVDWQQRVPELTVSEHVWCLPGEFVGPWPTARAAHEALGLCDLFDLCRHPEQLRKTPHGSRCAYAEMQRCDAPCDGSAPLSAYIERCRETWAFATGGAACWATGAELRMRAAAQRQQYELAARIKRQLEFAHHWQQHWGTLVRPAGDMTYLLALPVTRRKAWKLLLFRHGELADGPIVTARATEKATQWFRQQLAKQPAEVPTMIRMEQTWLLCHLLFSREAQAAVIAVGSPGAVDEIATRLADSAGKRERGSGASA